MVRSFLLNLIISCPVSVLRSVFMVMMEDGSRQLLRQFVEVRSEEAFRDLVRLHAPMVFNTALRQLAGDRAAAEDVTQEVFTLLSRKAAGLGGVVLAGWLYRQTCRRASNLIRTETRRKLRETSAMEQVDRIHRPDPSDDLARELDAAMETLPTKSRDALVIRYFEGADFSTVGRALGISEEAARKQVHRALERLGAIFKRKGITVASVSLGGTLSGFGATPLPDGFVSRISTQALKGAPVAVGSGWFYLLKPMIAGVAATSLVTAAAMTIRSKEVGQDSLQPLRVEGHGAALSRSRSISEDTSLVSLINEIKRVSSGPANALTTLRLSVVLDQIGDDQVAEFIRLANGKLNPQERAATYGRLLERWLEKDPESAMTFVLEDDVGKQVDPHTGSKLILNLFEDWLRRDDPTSRAWLLKHWENPVLKESAFMGALGMHLARNVVDRLIRADDKQPLRDFLRALPTDADRKAAFDSLAGNVPWGSLNRFGDVNEGLDCFRFIRELPDSAWNLDVARKYLSHWMETDPDVFEKAASTLPRSDRFLVALARLSTRQVSGERIPGLSGGFTVQSKPNNASAREQEAIQAGLDLGLPRGEILASVGAILLDRLSEEDALAWVDAHRGEVQLDECLADRARRFGSADGAIDQVPFEIIGIRWASRISDVELRVRMCRGAFRKLCARDLQNASEWLDKPDLPSDMHDTFQALVEESR